MFVYEKKLQYPVRIKNTNPKLASIIISQYGGPDGELGASLRYLSQRYSMPYPELKGLLTDIGTEELAHLEMVSAIVYHAGPLVFQGPLSSVLLTAVNKHYFVMQLQEQESLLDTQVVSLANQVNVEVQGRSLVGGKEEAPGETDGAGVRTVEAAGAAFATGVLRPVVSALCRSGVGW